MWSRRQSLAGVAALAALATDSGAWAGVGENQPQAAKRPETAQRLILIGDSTVADYPPARRPLAGWGQMLRAQLAGRAYVVNHAVPGASSTSFRRQKWVSSCPCGTGGSNRKPGEGRGAVALAPGGNGS